MDQKSLRQTLVDLKEKLREHEHEAIRIRQLLDGLAVYAPPVSKAYKHIQKAYGKRQQQPTPVPISERVCPHKFGDEVCPNKATRVGGICQTHFLRLHSGQPINGPRQGPTSETEGNVPTDEGPIAETILID